MIKINCNEKTITLPFPDYSRAHLHRTSVRPKEIAPGVIKLQKGEIDTFTPIPCLVASLS